MSDEGVITVHVSPSEDLHPHRLEASSCWCHPAAEPVGHHQLVVHNAADQRERYERGERLLA